MKRTSFVLLSLLLLSAISCTKPDSAEVLLRRIDEISEIAPKHAIAMLDSLNNTELPEDSRHHCDLLMIKARDKGYVTHSSDSLILDVIEYYSRQKNNPLYAEALYYGGRVYSDLNKYDTAIEYFNMAVNAMSESKPSLGFQGAVHSQYGRLLSKLGLDVDAVFHLAKAVDICRSLKDYANEVSDLHLLGLTFLHRDDRDSALACFSDALKKSRTLSRKTLVKSLVHMAYGYMKCENTDSAIHLLRQAKDRSDQQFSNSLNAMAAQIYNKAELYDSTFIYAKKLADGTNPNNKKIGYQLLSSPELRPYINNDSLDYYIESYAVAIDNSTLDANRKEALLKQSTYNLRRQFQINDEHAASRKMLIVFVILLSIIPIAIFLVADIQRLLKRGIMNHDDSADVDRTFFPQPEKRTYIYRIARKPALERNYIPHEPMTREVFCMDKKERATQHKNKIPVPECIIHSKAYAELSVRIRQSATIDECDQLWDSLLDAVKGSSPRFLDNLTLLMGCSPSVSDLHTCILIRCNIGTKQMANIFGISQSGVVSRRRKICQLAYSEDINLSCMDNVIRLL